MKNNSMRSRGIRSLLLGVSVLLATITIVGAGELPPPANAKMRSSIIQSFEERNQSVITGVEFDDGFWEVKLHKDDREIRLDIDPRNGETRR